jgi:hypothetical protein
MAEDQHVRAVATWHETIIASPDEALVVDHAAADVADHDAVLIATDAAGDSLLVHDVLADTCTMDDLAAELWARVEDTFEVSAQLSVSACDDSAARVFDDTVI